MRTLYVAETCPDAPAISYAQHYDERADALEAGGEPWYEGEHPLEDRAHAATLRREGRDMELKSIPGVMYLHLDGVRDHTMVCPCAHWADFLCDSPIGKSKTCDRPMCHCCREEVGEGFDRCDYHRAVQR